MNALLPYFTHPAFLLAGLAAAAVPIVIHLLNRRRYKTIPWAAMEFLRLALARNRRIMRLRDLLLLAIRTAAVVLFALALAGASCTPVSRTLDTSRPVHAIVVLDNSLPMAWRTPLAGRLFEAAQERATEFVGTLPPGSRVTVVPLVTAGGEAVGDAVEPADAVERIAGVEVVDAFAAIADGVRLAAEAAARGPAELTDRVVLFSDQRAEAWRGLDEPAALAGIGTLTAVSVLPEGTIRENAFVEDVTIPDGGPTRSLRPGSRR